jgi:hypothetical protein
VLLALPLVAPAQEVAALDDKRTYGTGVSIPTLQAGGFSEASDLIDTTSLTFQSRSRFCTASPTRSFLAPVFLPAGAQVVIIQLQACSLTTTNHITASFGTTDVSDNATTLGAVDISTATPA